jgi:PAS domain S-box-containing protein
MDGRVQPRFGLDSAIVGSTDEAVVGTADGIVLTWNRGAELIFGYAAGEIVGRHVRMLAPPDRQREVEELVERLRCGEHIEGFQTVRRRKDGRLIDVSMTLSPIFDEKGKVIGAATVAHDISEHKRSDEEISRLNTELRRRVAELTALAEELEAFSYSVSHDLRAPLSRIIGFAEILQSRASKLDAQERHFVEVIARSAHQMADLIRDLLDFSRARRGEARVGRVDLDSVVAAARRDLEPESAGRRVTWRVARLPMVRGDAAMLHLVFLNLLSNALKFTRGRKEAVIEVGCARGCEGPGSEAVLFVKDNGAGFDMGKAARLFQPFHRLHSSSEFEGTGVGLATVRRVLARHGGRIWADSRPGRGATFYFSLPRAGEVLH